VTMRLACGSGSATQRYGWSDVRGFATRFHLPDSSATDLVSVTLPEFFAPTPQTFLDFTLAAKPPPRAAQNPIAEISRHAALHAADARSLPPARLSARTQARSPMPTSINMPNSPSSKPRRSVHRKAMHAPAITPSIPSSSRAQTGQTAGSALPGSRWRECSTPVRRGRLWTYTCTPKCARALPRGPRDFR